MKKNKAKVIGIISIKGGVGKTTLVSNIGSILAKDFGKKTLLVDANFSAPNLGLHLGLIEPDTTIHDVLSEAKNIFSSVYEHASGFHIIPASLKPTSINPLKLKSKLKPLKDHYDVILLDSSPTLNEEILATIDASDELVVITSPDYPTLSTTLQAVKLADHLKAQIRGLVINKVKNKKYELSLEDIEAAAEKPVISIIPDDIKVYEALFSTQPVALHSPKTKASRELKRLAAYLVDEDIIETGLLYKFRSLFGRRKIRI